MAGKARFNKKTSKLFMDRFFPENRFEMNQAKRECLKLMIDYIPEDNLNDVGKELFLSCEVKMETFVDDVLSGAAVSEEQDSEMIPRLVSC